METGKISKSKNLPLVSVIVPCRNEERYIDVLLENIVEQTYPKDKLEVFIVDGLSTDKTPELIKEWTSKHTHFNYLINENKIVSSALNKGIEHAKGEIIIRMDAHAEYPVHYVSGLVNKLYELDADNVGAAILTLPSKNTLEANLVADSISNPFGIGNSYFRLPTSREMIVDTVPFGCFRKEVFEKVGVFDEELVRNQDDEFNARLVRAGGIIYLIPQIKIRYFARENLNKMVKMFYQYGLFKPLVNLKIGKPATLRQFFPVFFTLFILSVFFLPFISKGLYLAALFILVLYFLLGIGYSLRPAIKRKNILYVILMPLTFLTIHLSYGTGYLAGIFRFIIFRKKSKQQQQI